MRHLRDQRGQSALEYLGILTAVAAILLVIIAASPRFGQTIVCGIDAQLAKVTGGEGSSACAALRAEANPEPTEPCIIRDGSGQLKATITVASIKGGGEVKILREYLSDGTVRVTLSGGANLGLEAKAGASGGVDAGTFELGGGAGAKISAALKGEAGGAWDFGSEQEADEFVEIIRNKARDGAINAAGGIPGRIFTGIFGEDRKIPDPRFAYFQGGAGATGSAEAGGGTAYANAGFDASSVAGIRVDLRSGEKAIYYTLKGSGDFSAGNLIGFGAQGDLEGTLVVFVAKDGTPLKAQVIGKGAVAGSDLGDAAQLRGMNPTELIKKFKGAAGQQDGYRGEVRGSLDLTKPENAAAFARFVANPLTGTDDLAGAFGRGATWDARVYEFDRTKVGAGGSGGLGLTFGADFGYEGVDSDLKGAWYWNGPGSGGIEEWASCG